MAGFLPPAPFNQAKNSASTSDIMSAVKNIVTAINNLATYTLNNYKNLPTSQLAQFVAANTLTSVYTASSGVATHVNTITVCNTTGGASTFSICFVPAGGTAGAANAIYYSAAIAANATVLITATLVLPAGASIYASAGAAATVTMTFSGGTVT
jgi:hypothetical protein